MMIAPRKPAAPAMTEEEKIALNARVNLINETVEADALTVERQIAVLAICLGLAFRRLLKRYGEDSPMHRGKRMKLLKAISEDVHIRLRDIGFSKELDAAEAAVTEEPTPPTERLMSPASGIAEAPAGSMPADYNTRAGSAD